MHFEPSQYAFIWSKYRPVILQLMSASGNGPQQYKLSAHEFKAMVPREKSGYSFLLEASQGKAVNNIKGSAIAQDLLHVLQQSQRASQLMREDVYALSMDKQFVFHVSRKQPAVVAEVAPLTEG